MFLVGIAGGSGSGKTTFAKKVLGSVQENRIKIVHQDSYYLSKIPNRLSENDEPNFDHPEAFDWDLVRAHLRQLKAGKGIQCPKYDFKTNRRLKKTEPLRPTKVVVFEGIYALFDPEIRGLMDLKVFLHVDADIRFIRRLHRDVRERGRSLDGIIRQYYDTVRPMHHRYLEPTQQFADLVVGEETDIAAHVVADHITRKFNE